MRSNHRLSLIILALLVLGWSAPQHGQQSADGPGESSVEATETPDNDGDRGAPVEDGAGPDAAGDPPEKFVPTEKILPSDALSLPVDI